MLYRIAKEVGATKIALGHHADDFIETLLLNLFFAGALKAMPAKLVSDDGAHVVIRPLVYVGEDEARAYTKECELPIIGCCCPACGDLGLQRQRIKRLLMELEREHPGVKQSMLKALGNVAPRHLLDTRLNPPAELRRQRISVRRHASHRVRVAARAGRRPRMRAVVQRVSSAAVTVDDRDGRRRSTSGLLVFVGVEQGDGPADVQYIAGKIRELRVFEDPASPSRHMNRSVRTSAAPCSSSRSSRWRAIAGRAAARRSTRPRAPRVARPLYEDVVRELQSERPDGGDRRVSGDDAGLARQRRTGHAAAGQQKAF